MATYTNDDAITALVNQEVERALTRYKKTVIRKMETDEYNMRRFPPHEFVRLYCPIDER